MRGRSVLKEPSGSSLCAFCAHRLGAARRPSHVQRRFIQSSRTSLKPPAEGAALREDDGNRGTAQPPQSSSAWGRSGGFGSTSSWGRSAFGNQASSAEPSPSWGTSSVNSIGKPGSGGPSQTPQSSPTPDLDDLLPHEKLARENMLKKEVSNRKRKVDIPMGPGPAFTRSSRPLPTSEAERLEWAKNSLNKRKAQEQQLSHKGAIDMGGFKLRRYNFLPDTVNVTESPPSRHPRSDMNEGLPKWSMLRRRGEGDGRDKAPLVETAQDQRKFNQDRLAEDRAQREEQAKLGRYVPLSRKGELQNSLHSSLRPAPVVTQLSEGASKSRQNTLDREVGQKSQPLSMGSRSIFSGQADNSRGVIDKQHSRRHSQPRFTIHRPGSKDTRDSGANTRVQEQLVDRRDATNERDGPTDLSSKVPISENEVKFSPLRPAEQKTSRRGAEEAEEEEERQDRESRRRKPGRYTEKAAPVVYDDAPRGRGRDKARRRQQFVEEEEDNEAEREAARERAELKRRRKAEKAARKAAAPTPILLPEYISVSNLAVALKVRLEDFVQKLEELGFEEMSHDYILNSENAGLIAMEYNFEAIIDKGDAEDLKARESAPDPSILPPRPPVVTIMGHVDHGKTTLLDWLRKSSVAATEHGGITQHIGAFSVPMPSGKVITFLDTPGHAAFLSMRQRGANVTDIVILVVAADDSVKPQTIEAIKHAQAAKVPIIVAINKIDKEDSNVDRVKQDLARHGLDVEDFGGDTQAVCVSGKTGQGMDELEEAAVTLSEILDMRAETDGPAEGWVLEASIKSMGKVATILVRRGTMRPGDFIVAGKTWARIRCLRNEAGVEIEEATPGMPVEIDGWREQPDAGDEVLQAPDEAKAKSVVDYRLEKEERDKMAQDMEAINENRKAEQDKREREKAEAAAAAEALENDEENANKPRDKPSGTKEIFFIVKGDVSGSVEAVVDSISAIGNKEVRPHILRSGVGQLSEFDIEHAAAANGVLINFNTTVDPNIAQMAASSKVPILDHNIIYRLVDDVKAELSKHLAPLVTHRVLGEAEIAEIFQITIKGRQQKPIAGSKVRNGTISKNAKVRVLRGGEKVFDGSLSSLKSVKKDVQEMKKGSECGIGFDGWFDFQIGDHVQSYEEISEKRYL